MKSDSPQPDQLRRYLLGSLSDEERDALEDAIFASDETYDRLVSIENELIDDCATGALSGPERLRFLRYLSRLPGRERELRVASALVARTEERDGSTTPAAEPLARRTERARWPDPRLLSAAAVVLVFAGAAWTLSVVSRLSSDAQVHTDVGYDPGAPFVLREGRLRGVGTTQSRPLSPSAPVLELQLDLARNDYEAYRAVLYDAESLELVALNRLRALESVDAIRVTLALPTAVLTPGDYYIELSGVLPDGARQSLARYDFRLTTQ